MPGSSYAKHLTAELLSTTCAITLFILALTVGARARSYLDEVVQNEMLGGTLMWILLLRLGEFISLILPLAFFLALLSRVARMQTQGERMALSAIGASPARLLYWILPSALLAGAVIGLLSLAVNPSNAQHSSRLLAQASVSAANITPKQTAFTRLPQNLGSLYVETASEQRAWSGVLHGRTRGEHLFLTTAERLSAGSSMSLQGGTHYRFDGRGLVSQTTFADYILPIHERSRHTSDAIRNLPTGELLGRSDPAAAAELQLRAALPLMPLMGALMLLPLMRPRRTRIAPISMGRLVGSNIPFVIYFALLVSAGSWVADGWLPTWPGVWGVHLLGLLLLLPLWRSHRSVWLPGCALALGIALAALI
ncbi:MAG: LptF/LptG family permease [Gammaproteobacteria bacterium AqS3]|nr:LptF/LptG family permease [Gammaproteobacteria bacterium AqS3]